ncbi:hypothetical protein [Lentiprolixibacter aurantiacus]|uniref:Uncharacterized protein n=1 Tax=Lentiprolixibacter aurantiacus TaxID=2993939 RepID=A0AAE3SP31_9FLAO|nr:hypothetical protein [Lentiprolixibacter aurantiacus]MCX2720269.1 hypothetical protein [Lentiprolixibacter aurantiacus]
MEQHTNNDKQYPEGHFVGMWMGIGIAIFTGLGVALSAALQNFAFIGVGPAIGVGFGLPIGQAIENKYKAQGRIRPLTESEKQSRKNFLIGGLLLFLAGVVVFAWMYFRK